MRFSLRSLLAALVALSVLIAISVRHYESTRQQKLAVMRLRQLGGKNGNRPKISFCYDNYAQWNDDHTTHVFVIPPTHFPTNGTGPVEPKGIKGWAIETFGRDCIYRPVVMTYDCWNHNTKLKFTDEMTELVHSLPIREIRLSKSVHASIDRINAITERDYEEISARFPKIAVTRIPNYIHSERQITK